MTVDRILTMRGHVEVDQIVSAMEDSGVESVRVERTVPPGDVGVPLYFWCYFQELGSDEGARGRKGRKKDDERTLRCHHGNEGDSEGPFPGENYTYIATGAYGCTDTVLKALGQRFGGVYHDEGTGEEVVFEAVNAPAP